MIIYFFGSFTLRNKNYQKINASEESKPPSVRDGIRLSAIPELGWTSVISALFWLAPTGFRRFIRFPRDLSLAASSH